MTTKVANPEAQLEDVMAAMDVVDTLRHEQGIAKRELDTQGRKERLLNRLRELYQAQGIEVSDRILEEGIDALEQERFEYIAIEPSWRTKLAHLWVSRKRWGKPLGIIVALIIILSIAYFFFEIQPKKQARNNLPNQIDSYLSTIKNEAKNTHVITMAQEQAASAHKAVSNEAYQQANHLVTQLESISIRLQAEYEIRVISRMNENSGVWRIPPHNTNIRNFYIIVEAFDYQNKTVSVDVLNEENNTREIVDIWGLRVNEDTFYSIAADKKDDGIIQKNIIGQKKRGYLEPTFNISTSGAAITEW